jgi:hypothetical protein
MSTCGMRLLRLLNVAVLCIVIGALVLPPASATPPGAPGAAAAASAAARAPAAVIPTAPPFEHVSSIGGALRTAVISGTLAYVVEGNALLVLDISNPAAPQQRSKTLVAGLSTLALAGHLLYFTSANIDRALLQIADVSNPVAPILLGRYDLVAAGSMQVVGTRVYIEGGNGGGFEIVDVGDPTHPRHLGEYRPSVDAMYVAGNLVYLLQNAFADLHGLIVLDVSDPAHPTVVTAFAPADNGIPAYYHGLSVVGNRAYFSAGYSHCSLYTYDLSNPAAPELLGSGAVDACGLKAVSGQLAYTSVYTSTAKLQIWDISDPAAPVLQSTYSGLVDEVQVVGALVYIIQSGDFPTEFKDSLQILDVSDPVHPVVRGSYHTHFQYADAVSVPPGGNTGYTVGEHLQILNLTNPASPTLRGSYYGAAAPLSVAGTHVYAGSFNLSRNTLQTVDVANPDAPALSSTTVLTGSIHAITAANQLVYVLTSTVVSCGHWFCTDYRRDLTILDTGDPAHPQVMSVTRLANDSGDVIGMTKIILVSSLAYIATNRGILAIVDISNPAQPQLLTNYQTPGIANDIQVVGDLAYVADGSAGLTILDISNPLSPTVRGRYESEDWILQVRVSDGLAYLFLRDKFLVVDVHDPAHPLPRASYSNFGVEAVGYSGSLQVVGDLVYVAAAQAGLQILRVHPDRFPPPAFLPLISR